MTLQVFDFEGANGATLTGTNVAKTGTGTLAFSAADAVVGGTGGRATATAGNSLVARCTINAGKVQAVDCFIRTPTTPSSGTYALLTLRHASGVILTVEYNTLNGIGLFEQATSTRNNVSGVTLANNTVFRVQLLVSIGVATNDSSFTAKIFSSASNWTTQVGSTLTRSAINLGTVNAEKIDVGAVTVATPGLVVGFDYLRVDDGKTTDFTGPPTASAPTAAVSFSDQYAEVLTPVNLLSTGSTAGTGSITGYAWTCIEFPAGASSPAITNPTSATATFTPTAGGHYGFQLVVTQTGGLTATATGTEYVHPASADDVLVYSVTPGSWTNEGGAASFVVALNDSSSTTYAQSVANPTGQILRCVMDPYGPGSVTFFISGNWTGGALNRTVSIYMADGVTLLVTETYALTSVEVEHAISLDAGDLATASPGANRAALVVDISDAP